MAVVVAGPVAVDVTDVVMLVTVLVTELADDRLPVCDVALVGGDVTKGLCVVDSSSPEAVENRKGMAVVILSMIFEARLGLTLLSSASITPLLSSSPASSPIKLLL